VDQGVTFTIGNNGSSDFIFNWTDPGYYSDSFSNKLDPTLRLSVGQTYTFRRGTSGHNFVLLKPSFTYMTGNEQQGYYRNTTSDAFISNHTYGVAVAGGNVITFKPTDQEINLDFWYTCQVGDHTGMAGKITVIPEPSTLGLAAAALLGLALVKQRSRRTKGPGLSDRSGSASQS
jgi:plastocyanin